MIPIIIAFCVLFFALIYKLNSINKHSAEKNESAKPGIEKKDGINLFFIIEIGVGMLVIFFALSSLFPEDWAWFRDQDYFWPASIAIIVSFIMLQFKNEDEKEEEKGKKGHDDGHH